MRIFSSFFPALIPLVIIIVAIAVAVGVARRRGKEEVDRGIGTTKRLFYYVVSFVALMVTANGLVLLVRYVVDSLRGGTLVVTSNQQLALGLALSIVGTPLWLLFWSMAQRSVRNTPEENRSLVRKLYIYLVLGISLGFLAAGLVSLLRAILGSTGFEGNHVAQPLIWGALWAYHWRVESAEGQPSDILRSLRRVYLYIVSLVSVIMLMSSVGLVLRQALLELYNAVVSGPTLIDAGMWGNAVRSAVAVGLVGAGGWWWHWHRALKGDTGSLLRGFYLYIFAILGGAIAAVASLSLLVYAILQWLMGAPNLSPAGDHFRLIPGTLATILASGAVWGYHSIVLRQEAQAATGRIASVRRVYRYLLASLGLGVLATALTFLISMVVSLGVAQARDLLAVGGWWKNALSLVLTLLVVGASIWGYFWPRVQAEAAQSTEERSSTTRKVFLYVLFGVAVLAALGSLSTVLYFFLQDMLKGELSGEVLRNAKWGLGVLLSTGAISVYYWLVLQEDRRVLAPLEAAAQPVPTAKVVTVLASERALPLVERLEAGLSYQVTRWRSPGMDEVPTLTDEQVQDILSLIQQSPSGQVLVVVEAGGVRVLPYEE